MDVPHQELVVYKAPNGKHPYLVWLERLNDTKAEAAILKRLDRVAMGLMGDCKALGEQLYELRIHVGPGYRVYLAQEPDHLVLLLLGGDKSTQAQDIQKAREYHRDYKSNPL
jgi:putative addiction module killer protein